jgi:hypothetical protein
MAAPIIICDKSTIQSLNRDEAFWLGMHYRMNMVPIFYIEVLADLHKSQPGGRASEEMVASIAAKIPGLGTLPNIYHGSLVLGDLLGHPVAMNHVPVIRGGAVVETPDGKKGTFFDLPPEMAARERWAQRDFLGLERDYARVWRQALATLDLEAVAKAVQGSRKLKLRDLSEVKAAADKIAEGRGSRLRTLKVALQVLAVPTQYQSSIISRWKNIGGPILREFAPYADYVFRVELFFYLGLATGKIPTGRPSHRTDLAYLFYLPFCALFSSCDRFQVEIVPLFLAPGQEFVHGHALKADLAALALHYSALPGEVHAKGAFAYANYPPLEGDFLTSQLYDRLMPGWRKHAAHPIEMTPELNQKIMQELKPVLDAIDAGQGRAAVTPNEGDENAVLSFRASRQQGKWKRF